MSKINVLHLINAFGDSSISRIILRLIPNMGMNDIHWHVGGLYAYGSGEFKGEFSSLGAKVIDFSKNGSIKSYESHRGIREYICENQIRIIHTHTPRTIFSAALSTIGMKDIIHVATKHLLTLSDDRKWGTLVALMDRLSLHIPDRLIPVSQKMCQQIIRQPGIRTERVTTIRNAIPCEQFYVPEQRDACRKEMGISPDSIVMGYTGRIQKVKRIDLLLDAFAQINRVHQNTHLILAGDGEDKNRLKTYADNLGIADRITWTGFRKDIPRILAALDIYVQTSFNEGLSLSILEAMAAGIPVVATDVGGNSEVITHQVNGLLVPAGAIDELVNAVLCLIEHTELSDQFSVAGLELIRNEFSLDSMVNGYRNLYENVLSENNLL